MLVTTIPLEYSWVILSMILKGLLVGLFLLFGVTQVNVKETINEKKRIKGGVKKNGL
jgi:hypothetical protein